MQENVVETTPKGAEDIHAEDEEKEGEYAETEVEVGNHSWHNRLKLWGDILQALGVVGWGQPHSGGRTLEKGMA